MTNPSPPANGWEDRESVEDLYILGGDQGQHKQVSGLLIQTTPDKKYAGNIHFHFEQKDGSVLQVPGSASLLRQLGPQDVGLFVRISYEGMGKSANGRYKIFKVQVYTGAHRPEFLQWPSYKKLFVWRRDRDAAQHAAGTHAASNGTPRKEDPTKPDHFPFGPESQRAPAAAPPPPPPPPPAPADDLDAIFGMGPQAGQAPDQKEEDGLPF